MIFTQSQCEESIGYFQSTLKKAPTVLVETNLPTLKHGRNRTVNLLEGTYESLGKLQRPHVATSLRNIIRNDG